MSNPTVHSSHHLDENVQKIQSLCHALKVLSKDHLGATAEWYKHLYNNILVSPTQNTSIMDAKVKEAWAAFKKTQSKLRSCEAQLDEAVYVQERKEEGDNLHRDRLCGADVTSQVYKDIMGDCDRMISNGRCR